MGVGIGLGLMLAGGALAGGGMYMSGRSADKKRAALEGSYDRWLPNPDLYQKQFFGDMERYLPQATKLSRDMSAAESDAFFAAKERALPGFTSGIQQAGNALFPLLRGELPQGVMDAFTRAGGASSVGLGFGGTPFGALNTGLFGARGALGAMQTGFGLLPSLMGALPNLAPTSISAVLGQGVMTPQQRTNAQLAVRGQNMGVATQLGEMPTSGEIYGQGLSQVGGGLIGSGAMGVGGGMGGAGGGFSFAQNPSMAAQSASMQSAMNRYYNR